MEELKGMPNVGKITIKRLKNVGITTGDELISLGSKEVYKKLLAYEGDTCLDTLYGLEGAVEGIRWCNLSDNTKKDLKSFFREINDEKK